MVGGMQRRNLNKYVTWAWPGGRYTKQLLWKGMKFTWLIMVRRENHLQ